MNFSENPIETNEAQADSAEQTADAAEALPTRDQVDSLVGELDQIDLVLAQLDEE